MGLSARRGVATAVAFAIAAFACAALAQTPPYPSRPIRLIIPVQPGSSTNDSIPRAFANYLSVAVGQTVVTDNRPGASGQIASETVAKSAPDGYTLLVGYTTTLGIGPAVHEKLPYDPDKDLVPVARLFVSSYVVAVNTMVPANTLKELIDLARAKPGQLHYASAGTGSTPHLCTELFMSMTGIQMQHIPYKGGAPAMIDTVAGHTDLYCTSVTNAAPMIQQGRIRAIGVTSIKRSPVLPNLATLDEQGLKGFDVSQWMGIAAPAKTPPAIVQRLHQDIARVVNSAEYSKFIQQQGAEPALMGPEEFGALMRAELERWGKLVRAIKVTAD